MAYDTVTARYEIDLNTGIERMQDVENEILTMLSKQTIFGMPEEKVRLHFRNVLNLKRFCAANGLSYYTEFVFYRTPTEREDLPNGSSEA